MITSRIPIPEIEVQHAARRLVTLFGRAARAEAAERAARLARLARWPEHDVAMRVLTVDDLGFDHRGGSLYLRYQKEKERLARLLPNDSSAVLGLREVPT